MTPPFSLRGGEGGSRDALTPQVQDVATKAANRKPFLVCQSCGHLIGCVMTRRCRSQREGSPQ